MLHNSHEYILGLALSVSPGNQNPNVRTCETRKRKLGREKKSLFPLGVGNVCYKGAQVFTQGTLNAVDFVEANLWSLVLSIPVFTVDVCYTTG